MSNPVIAITDKVMRTIRSMVYLAMRVSYRRGATTSDISGFLARGVEDAPIDVMWWSGAGLGWGENTVVSVPLGALLGWSGQGGDVILSPYGGGHVTLDISDIDGDNVSMSGAFDFGLDVVLSSGWLVRFGGSIGDREALAIGVKIDT